MGGGRFVGKNNLAVLAASLTFFLEIRGDWHNSLRKFVEKLTDIYMEIYCGKISCGNIYIIVGPNYKEGAI